MAAPLEIDTTTADQDDQAQTMYGTVARLQIKPDAVAKLQGLAADWRAHDPKHENTGLVAQFVFRLDADPATCYLAVVFISKAAYQANAASPQQHARYLQIRECLTAEPERHDGQIVFSSLPAGR